MADSTLKALSPDYTGKSLQNRIEQELHSIQFGQDRPFLIPRYAPFYREGLKVYNSQSGLVYDEGKHYVLGHSYPEASEAIGRSVYGSIVFIDQSVAKLIKVDYQALGGQWGISEKKLAEELANRTLNPLTRTWGMISGQLEAFPPVDHDQDLSDVDGSKELNQAIYTLIAAMEANAQGVNADHLADHNNPHKTTSVQVGLGNVQNFPLASEDSAKLGNARDQYLTPYLARLLVEALTQVYKDHLGDKKNPHNVTKDTVGLGKVQNFPVATKEEALEGKSNTLLLTPMLAHEMITELGADNVIQAVRNTIESHISNHENPHNVTAAQLGVYTTAAVDALLLNVTSKDTARFGSMTVNDWRESLPSHADIEKLLVDVATVTSDNSKRFSDIKIADGAASNRIRPVGLFGNYQGYSIKTNKGAFVQVGRHFVTKEEMVDETFFERRDAGYFIDKDGLVHHNGDRAARPPVAYRPGSPVPSVKPTKLVAVDGRGYLLNADKSVFTWTTDASEMTELRQVRSIFATPGDTSYVVAVKEDSTAVALGSKEFVAAANTVLSKEVNVQLAYVNDKYLVLLYATGTLSVWRIDLVDSKLTLVQETLPATVTEKSYVRIVMNAESFIGLTRDNQVRGYGANRNNEVVLGKRFLEVMDVAMSDNFSIILDRQWGIIIIGDVSRDVQPPKLNRKQ